MQVQTYNQIRTLITTIRMHAYIPHKQALLDTSNYKHTHARVNVRSSSKGTTFGVWIMVRFDGHILG